MTDKTEATRLADALDDSLCPMCHQAAALLRRWPEGEPCVWVDEVSLAWLAKRLEDHATITTTLAKQRALNRAVPLYATPPDQSDRIAALEAALEELLRHFTKAPSTLADSEARGRAHDVLRSIAKVQR